MAMDDERLHFHDDDGTEIAPDLIAKPGLCVACGKDDDPSEAMLCTLIRLDQRDEDEFRCDAYVCKGS
jgi:hypothetical protein